MLNMNT